MKIPKLSLAEQKQKLQQLRKQDWWWRRPDVRRKEVSMVDWETVEIAARNYELLRRSPQGKLFPKTYLELSPAERTLIHGLWVTWPRKPFRFASNRDQFTEIGWSPIRENQHRQWNLRLSISELTKEFVREIKLLQKIQKIRPAHPLKEKKFRGVSWKMVEMMDRKAHGIGKMNASERHTLSAAKQLAKQYFEEYQHVIPAG